MWKIVLICVAVAVMNAEAIMKRYAGSYAGAGGFASASAGGYGNGIYTGGYAGDYGAGNFVGTGFGTGFGYAPDFGFGFIDPYVFHQQLTASILAQHAAQNSALASTYTTGDETAYADASLYPDDEQIQQQIAQQAYFDSIRRQSPYNTKGYKAHRYAPNFAAAGGSIGPGGFTQTAYISPENPAIPNIQNRFSSSSGGPGGFKGVSVSSYSSSSDIDGKRTNVRGAQTTVNDNGKITTYRVHN